MDTSESSNGAVTAMFGVGAILGGSFVMLLSDRLRLRRPFQLLGSVFYIVAGVIFYFAKRFYHMILFRLVNGVASGIACTLLYTAVGDVYPANLLGFKVAIVYFCNNISYTIGPICGEKLFDKGGIPAIASVVIALGVLEFALVFTVVEDSLVLRNFLQRSSQTLPDSLLRASETDTYSLHMIDASTNNKSTPNISGNNIDEACFTRLENSNSMTITPADKRQPHEQPPPQPEETITTANSDAKANPQSVTLWRLLFNVHVLVPTISIIVSIGIQCMLEAVVPLHLDDAFDMSSRSGITFVIYGLALTILVPVIGKINDLIIEYRGSHMRYYLMLFGSVTSILTITLLALAKSYGLMMFGYVLYAITNLCMCIPAQSAYGDFANYLDSNSMAFIATAFGIGGLLGGLFVGYISDRTQNRIIPQASAALLYIVSGCILYFAEKFYQVVIFRIILGIASSVADTMLFTTVADVYPANLLGLKIVVETTIPLRLYDKFGYSPETIGIAFLIVGGVLIVAMPLVGYINDTVITKYGENMRYYTIAFGMVAILVSLLITGVASTYAVLIFGYALFAITAMVAIVPAQSAFGDFINSSDSEAMAQCYSLAWIAEGLANISLPPLSSGLYDAIGFLSMLMSLGSALCAFCVLAVLAFPLKMFWDFRKQAVA
ncbi:hypothetical protein GGI11_001968 [Coemansia sp. RSA 2049]|nr:hypothetical protein GGI11_001968 [Coemansia sp. RSA 2049]